MSYKHIYSVATSKEQVNIFEADSRLAVKIFPRLSSNSIVIIALTKPITVMHSEVHKSVHTLTKQLLKIHFNSITCLE
jgi:hypothetical protein